MLDRANTIWAFLLQALGLLGGRRLLGLLGFLRLLRLLGLLFIRGTAALGIIPMGRGLMVDNGRLGLLSLDLLGGRRFLDSGDSHDLIFRHLGLMCWARTGSVVLMFTLSLVVSAAMVLG